MKDIFFITTCNHRIQNMVLDIRNVDGEYLATFPYEPIRVKTNIFIRSWQDQQKYIRDVQSYKDMQAYIFRQGSGAERIEAPITGANTKIGITSYEFVDNYTIKFLPKPDGTFPVDINPDLVPKNIYLVDYTANPSACPRCNGTSVIKDVSIDSTGKAVYVEAENKIKQRVLKSLMTPLGSSKFDLYFGSELDSLIGTTITDETRITIQTTVLNAIQNLIQNQSTDYTEEETIQAVEGMTIETDPRNPSIIYVKVIVSNQVGALIDCAIGFNLED